MLILKKQRVLLTGCTGFIGRNLKELLSDKFELVAPTRNELNLLDYKAVEKFLIFGKFFSVLHFANPSPYRNSLDSKENLFRDSLKCYFSLRRANRFYERMFFLGSGAEFNKTRNLRLIHEESIEDMLPEDDYGFAKYIMTKDAKASGNVFNLRIFGCFGPTDAEGKFIRDSIDSCLLNRSITIRQDCYFDYMYVTDLFHVIRKMLNSELRYHDYNVCTGKRVALSEIASIIKKKMNNPHPIIIKKTGLNKEYTGSNDRLLSEFPDLSFTPLEEGIEKQILWQKGSK